MGHIEKRELFDNLLTKMDLPGILSFKSLKIGYVSGKNKNVLLPPLSACAFSGELIAVIGRNGIGKSTLLRTLTGLQAQIDGEIYYSDKNIREYSRIELAQKVGYISTEIIRVSNMTVYDLVALGRFPHTNWIGKIEMKDHEAIMDAIDKVSMKPFCRKFVSELSDGERQKATIARILAQDTDIMVMDEPTAFLDIAGKFEILHLMHKLSDKGGKTIIFSTHDLQMAVSQADKVWLVLDDQLIEGAPEDLMMAGAFDHLFDSSTVFFNSKDGTFSFRSEEKGTIYIDGDGKMRHWTEKAINRAGFGVSKEKTSSFLVVPAANNDCWQLSVKGHNKEFRTLYELITYIRR